MAETSKRNYGSLKDLVLSLMLPWIVIRIWRRTYMEDKNEEHERPWSDLLPDLLSIILSYLFAGDRVNFRLICKSYRSVYVADQRIPPHKDSSLSQSPCLMFLGNQFFHPIYNVIYHMDIAKVTRAIIQDSKYGWFLMTQEYSSLFIFNPITKVRIQLPDIPSDHCLACLHFSSPPTSLECQVIGFAPVLDKKVKIFTIKRNEDSWTVHESPQKRHFESSECNPILYNGVYYCLGRGGNLIIYDPKEDKCSWTGHDKALWKRLRASNCNSYMVESDGELLQVFVSYDGRWVGVFRLNLSSLIFEKVHSLGNRMLFVSHPANFSETALVRGTGNKIYLPKFHGKDGLFYSLATNKFHSFAASYSTDNFYGVRGYSLSTWIKPIFDTTCVDQFEW